MLLKILCTILLILYILLGVYYYKNINNNVKVENFVSMLDVLSDSINFNDEKTNIDVIQNNNDNKTDNKTDKVIENKNIKKFIYLEEYYDSNKLYKYNFNDKNDVNYMVLYEDINNYKKNIIIKNNKGLLIGEKLEEHYNKIVFRLELYQDNIILEYYDNYNYIKIYLENDDKIFMIRNNSIYLYELLIGKIKKSNNKYKIIVYEEYKTYLNILGIGYLMTLHN